MINLLLTLALAAGPSVASEPKLDLEHASQAALKTSGGGRVERAELVEEDGKPVWEFVVRDSSGSRQVRIDANTGEAVQTPARTDDVQRALDALEKKSAELEKTLHEAEASGRRRWEKVKPHLEQAIKELGRGAAEARSEDDASKPARSQP